MIIKSLLDTDLYKLTMGYAVYKNYPRSTVSYKFFNRRNSDRFTPEFGKRLREEIDKMSTLRLTDDEYNFLARNCQFIPRSYLDFLRGYQFDPREVTINIVDGKLNLDIFGHWYSTIFWEVPLMAMISELWMKEAGYKYDELDVLGRMLEKKDIIDDEGIAVADFGTRRRFSYTIQDLFLKHVGKSLVGTSNVHFAMKYGLKPIGTHAHEWFSYHGAKYGYRSANFMALDRWSETYRGELGIALTDTYTTDVFLDDFDTYFAKLFDGVRHDSGNPYEFGEKIVEHYQKLGIDPMTKTIVFSDGLDVDRAVKLARHFDGHIKTSFGIGTNFTNDLKDVQSLNMVIKLTTIENKRRVSIPTVKLSDTPGKNTSISQREIELCKGTLGVE